MEFIIDNYGKAIVIFLVVVSLIGILTFILRTDADGLVMRQFSSLIEKFFSSVNP